MSTEDAELPRAPHVVGPKPHLLMVRAPYYRDVVDGLTEGANHILGEAGVTADTLDVAGAYELPQAIRIALRGNRRFDGFIPLGCIVKGETDHYDCICKATIDGIMSVALQFGDCPEIVGVDGPDGIDCARLRSVADLRQSRPSVEKISRIGMDSVLQRLRKG